MSKRNSRSPVITTAMQCGLPTPRQIERGVKLSRLDNILGEEALLSPTSRQIRADEVARSSLLGAAARRRKAHFNPVVNFLLDATLNVLNSKEVSERTANIKEVQERGILGYACARLVTRYAVSEGYPVDQYIDDHVRLGLLRSDDPRQEEEIEFLQSDQLESLPSTTFPDVGLVAGGALNALHHAGIYDNAAAIIGRSPLLDISMIPKEEDSTFAVREHLGLPYTNKKNFIVSTTDRETTLEYTEEARRFMQGFREQGRGCPAWGVNIADTTLIRESWVNMIDYLVPEGATADY